MTVFREKEEPKEATFLTLFCKQLYQNVSIIRQKLDAWPYLSVRNRNLKQVDCHSRENQGSVAKEDKEHIGQDIVSCTLMKEVSFYEDTIDNSENYADFQ